MRGNTTSIIFLSIIITFIMLSGCTGNDNDIPVQDTDVIPHETEVTDNDGNSDTDKGEYIYGNATVEEIQIMILESFPVQINVVARGYLPDGCTDVDEIIKTREENAFFVTITTKRPADLMCTQVIVPFEKVISLDVYGLNAGEYQVNVNGVTSSFTLDMDNIIPE